MQTISLSFISLSANATCEYTHPEMYNYSGKFANPIERYVELTTTKGTSKCKEESLKVTCENGATFNIPRTADYNNFDIVINGQLITTTAYEVICNTSKPRGIDYNYAPGRRVGCYNFTYKVNCSPEGEETIMKWFTKNPINGTKVEITRKVNRPIDKLKDLN